VNIQNAVVCSKHFSKDDFETESKDFDRPLKRRRLKPDAVPKIFPGNPSYLSKPSRPRTSTATASSRLNQENKVITSAIDSLEEEDKIKHFHQLLSKLDKSCLPKGVLILEDKCEVNFIYPVRSEHGEALFYLIVQYLYILVFQFPTFSFSLFPYLRDKIFRDSFLLFPAKRKTIKFPENHKSLLIALKVHIKKYKVYLNDPLLFQGTWWLDSA
jgi:hypothetical protein